MVKTHRNTGLKYFCKTTRPDPYNYPGSGTYWRRHLKKHGWFIDTEIIAEFENDDPRLSEFALKFSEIHNVVKSDEWANLIPENGLDGGIKKIKPIKAGKINMMTRLVKGKRIKIRRSKVDVRIDPVVQRRREFDRLFGAFSVWALLPFQKLPEFWKKIRISLENNTKVFTEEIENFIKIIDNLDNYVHKFVQSLFPV